MNPTLLWKIIVTGVFFCGTSLFASEGNEEYLKFASGVHYVPVWSIDPWGDGSTYNQTTQGCFQVGHTPNTGMESMGLESTANVKRRNSDKEPWYAMSYGFKGKEIMLDDCRGALFRLQDDNRYIQVFPNAVYEIRQEVSEIKGQIRKIAEFPRDKTNFIDPHFTYKEADHVVAWIGYNKSPYLGATSNSLVIWDLSSKKTTDPIWIGQGFDGMSSGVFSRTRKEIITASLPQWCVTLASYNYKCLMS
jgi:hypothetical protein